VSRKKKDRTPDAVPDEILAEGSGAADLPTTVDELAEAVESLEARVAEAAAEDGDSDAEPVELIALADEDDEGIELAADDAVADEAHAVDAEPVEAVALAPEGDAAAVDGEVAAASGEDGEGAVGDVVAVLPTSAATLDDAKLKHLVEAIVFAADKPVTLQRLRQLTRIADVRRIEQALELLAQDFADRGIALQHVSGGYQFRTNTTYSAWVQQLVAGRPVRLSRAQLETLAIVAYRQPITRPEIDDIRGVDSSATLRLLLDRSLIRVLGKREEVGRPMLYGTTAEFLDFFSLQDLRELPTLREYSELTAESRQVMSDRLGVSIDGSTDSSADGSTDSSADSSVSVSLAPEPEPEPDRDHAPAPASASESEPAE
jgi:segregation and condensation protein B